MTAASGVRRFLVTATIDQRMSLWAATAVLSNWLDARGPEERETWLVMVTGEGADVFLEVAGRLGVTVEELEGAGDEEHWTLLVGEPGTGWNPDAASSSEGDDDG